MANPWAVSHAEDPTAVPESPVQQTNSYAVPSLAEGDAYADEFGWASKLAQRTSSVETPSAQRLGTIPLYQRDGRPNAPLMHDGLTDRLDADVVDRTRAASETTTSTGWVTPSGVLPGDRRWAPNPRSVPPPEERVTARLGQNTWSFFRLFDQHNRGNAGSARYFNGIHFSMADHRRDYEIYGMRPVTSRRNTYRMEPTPWDLDIVDLPPATNASVTDARIVGVELPYQSRSMRLT